jgi:phosphoserine phosphatase
MSDRVVALTVLGPDRRGLTADVSGAVTELGGNIVHVEQNSVYGMYSLFMLVEMGAPTPSVADDTSTRMRSAAASVTRDVYEFVYDLERRVEDFDVNVRAEVVDPEDLPSKSEKDLRVITILGSDKMGLMRAVTGAIADEGATVERMNHVAQGEFMAFEITVDVGPADFEALRDRVREAADEIGVDAVIQRAGLERNRKRLVVFDMDRTIVDGEVIDELARAAGVEAEVSEITERAMAGELDYEESLRERVAQLEGLPVEELERIAGSLDLTPGTYDLVRALKSMGYKLALISGGFTFFTDRLREELGFDYAFGNTLVIEDGKLTGEVEEPLIDPERKADILEDLAEREGLSREEVVAVGDGANDQIMIRNAGLGVAFNAQEILKRQADGALTKENLKGLLYALGATEDDLREIE